MEKPFYPIAPGQYFKNLACRAAGMEERKTILASWGIRNYKHLFLMPYVGAIALTESPESGVRVRHTLAECGLPINPAVHNKIFEATEHEGFHDSVFDQSLMGLLANCPMIPFEITKAMKTVGGALFEYSGGKFVTLGRNTAVSARGISTRSFFEPPGLLKDPSSIDTFVLGSDGNTKSQMLAYSPGYKVDATNLFISSNVADHTGLIRLPNSSIVWFWNDSRWVPCTVHATYADTGKMTFNLFEIKWKDPSLKVHTTGSTVMEKTAIFTVTDDEINIHKTIAKMIGSDTIRIAIKSATEVHMEDTVLTRARTTIMGLLGTEFKSPVLESMKNQWLGSSAHKNMSGIWEFANEVHKSHRHGAMFTLRFLPENILTACWSYAIEAAEMNTPLFWSYPIIQNTPDRNDKLMAALELRVSPFGENNKNRLLKMSDTVFKEMFKKVKVDCEVSLQNLVQRVGKAAPKKPLTLDVPTALLGQPQHVIKGFVMAHAKSGHWNDPALFESVGGSSSDSEAILSTSVEIVERSITIKP